MALCGEGRVYGGLRYSAKDEDKHFCSIVKQLTTWRPYAQRHGASTSLSWEKYNVIERNAAGEGVQQKKPAPDRVAKVAGWHRVCCDSVLAAMFACESHLTARSTALNYAHGSTWLGKGQLPACARTQDEVRDKRQHGMPDPPSLTPGISWYYTRQNARSRIQTGGASSTQRQFGSDYGSSTISHVISSTVVTVRVLRAGAGCPARLSWPPVAISRGGKHNGFG